MIINANALHIPLADRCVHTIVTSPPYYDLRDYGVSDQIGLEVTPDAYIANLVEVFRECKRILRDDGTLWVNIGDSYATHANKSSGQFGNDIKDGFDDVFRGDAGKSGAKLIGCKEKDLIGIPWMLAFALRADGWYLRSDIIWAKRNCMPESVKDRPTKSHEYIFLLSKSQKYYYDHEAVKTPTQGPEHDKRARVSRKRFPTDMISGIRATGYYPMANLRDVWHVATIPYKGAHYATFNPDLIKPCILAGAPEGGIVFDPFVGSGTTVMVARKLGRRGIGLDLNLKYLDVNARERLAWIQSEKQPTLMLQGANECTAN